MRVVFALLALALAVAAPVSADREELFARGSGLVGLWLPSASQRDPVAVAR